MTYLLIATGAVAGAILRYRIDLWSSGLNPRSGFPWGTFLINMTGSLLIGILFGALQPESKSRLLLMVGFCGSYTTFSTFSLEIFRMFEAGNITTAVTYALLSIVAGPALAFTGYALTRS